MIEVGDTSAAGIVFLSSDIAPGIRYEKTTILAFRSHGRGCNDDEEEEEDDDTEEEGGMSYIIWQPKRPEAAHVTQVTQR